MKLALLCYTFFIHPHSSPLLTLTFFISLSLLLHSSSSHTPLFTDFPPPFLPPSLFLFLFPSLSSPLLTHIIPLPLLSYQGKSVPVLCLEGFSQLLQTVSTRYPHKMEAFLTSINPTTEEDTSRNDRVHFFVRHFQVHVKWREVATFPDHTHTTGQVLGMCYFSNSSCWRYSDLKSPICCVWNKTEAKLLPDSLPIVSFCY